MIRIDEIYNHTFWPWFVKNLPGYRMFMCDPFGSSGPDSIKNYGLDDVPEHNYIFFFDQEPIYLDIHQATFNKLVELNKDIHSNDIVDYSTNEVIAKIIRDKNFISPGSIVTSEYKSDSVESICQKYNWRYYYYFFHGWAALDWYRGYDRTFLIKDYHSRQHRYSFISTNRIVGGRRDHRILLMYHLLKNNINSALISFPAVCPAEHQSVLTLSQSLSDRYPDIVTTLESAEFPWNMPGESGHPMHSCWLSLFEENANSLIHVITETAYFGRKWHLTEKTFKPICLQMPFVLVSTAGSLEYLRNYGFKTFGALWDESYDQETDDYIRLQKIANLLKKFDNMSKTQQQELHQACWPIVEHNFNHFYGGAFEQILWNEFTSMLSQIKQDLI